MKTALIYPPSADPTAPYLSVPMLTGFLRSKGIEVMPIDANIEAYDQLLCKKTLTAMLYKANKRLIKLKKKASLSHTDQLIYARLFQINERMRHVPEKIDHAVSVMRGKNDLFYDPVHYETALMIIEDALALISDAFCPLFLDFCSYKTPFSLLNINEIEQDARADHSPFYDYFETSLAPRLSKEKIAIAGISMAFPSQVQPAYTLAFILRRLFPDMYLVAGGPAITQLFVRLHEKEREKALGPFDSVVLYEGEQTLFQLISDIELGQRPQGVISGVPCKTLGDLPAPDFNGLPLDLYFSPEPVLPYDPSRGCYWGKCAFCHYGLAEKGTATYRERPVNQVADHLQCLSDTHACRVFYFSIDTLSPATARKLAETFYNRGTSFRFGSDIRPEPHLTLEWAKTMAQGGALSFALGIESGSKRILGKINKGVTRKDMQAAVDHLATAGIAAECMCFTQFPTETCQEAMETLQFLKNREGRIALFMCGEFGLTHGAGIADRFKEYGLSEIWNVQGDEFIKTLFYTEMHPSKTIRELDKIDQAVNDLSQSYWFHSYPWAGSLSTAHSLLWYDHYGPDVFHRFSGIHAPVPGHQFKVNRDIQKIEAQAQQNENQIWQTLVYERRSVSRKEYLAMASALTSIKNRFKNGQK